MKYTDYLNQNDRLVLASVFTVFGYAFGFAGAPFISLAFFVAALTLYVWYFSNQHFPKGGGPLSPA